MHVSNVSRAAGSSAIASCSYITARKMHDERTGLTSYGYGGNGRRERVEHVGTLLPTGAPEEWSDPERLFNAVEASEKRVDARPAKKIMVALPREFNATDRIRVVEDFITVNLVVKGYACTYAIHIDKGGRNSHAHILVANRRIDPKTGRWAAKSRSEFAVDTNGQRIPVIDPATGVQKVGARNRKIWKRVTVSNNPLDSKEFLERLRADWAQQCNLMLPKGVKIDHRSLEAQGIDRLPTIHEGYAAREITKRGGHSVLAAINERIHEANRQIATLKAKAAELGSQLERLKKELLETIGTALDGIRIVRTGHHDQLLHDLNKSKIAVNASQTCEQEQTAPEPTAEPTRRQETTKKPEAATVEAEARAPKKAFETMPVPKPKPRDLETSKTLEEQIEDAKRGPESVRQQWRKTPPNEVKRVQEMLVNANEQGERNLIRSREDLTLAFKEKLGENLQAADATRNTQNPHRHHRR